MNRHFLWIASCLLICTGLICTGQTVTGQEDPKSVEFFEKKIRPVLVRECYSCHSSQTGQARGGLMLDTQGYTHMGGDSGPAVVPGDTEESLLLNAMNYEDFRMPPGGRLAKSVRDDFRKWIEAGAVDPRVETIQRSQGEITPEDVEKGREFWAFKKPSVTTLPSARSSSWSRSPIDDFVYDKLQQNELKPAIDASATTLLRRLHFDLTGLPPQPHDITKFVKAYEKNPERAIEDCVDNLLASEQFGERWGRHWLDVARYAESTGREVNATYPHAWRYRDYVIDSFNKDKPYDRFIREQIAGDLLPAKTDAQWQENLIATGFLAIGPKALAERNGRQFQNDLIDEQIDATTRVVMGISVSCARCHDHKFDPIPQADYYAIAGIFQNTKTHYGTINTFQNRRPSDYLILPLQDENPVNPGISKSQLEQLKTRLAEKQSESREATRKRREMRSGSRSVSRSDIVGLARLRNEVAGLTSLIDQYDENGNAFPLAMGVQATDKLVNARFLERGEFDKPTDEIPRGFVQVISENPPQIQADSSGRRELAKWLTQNNPLTSRVMVNRIWQHLFGNGIVRTPENFGATGMPPTHPELLDYLAVEFEANRWSVKSLIKKIVTSRTYRMGSEFDETAFATDPDNHLMWRYEPRRLDAEALRDSLLAIGGTLDSQRPKASLIAKAGSGVVRDGQVFSVSSGNQGNSMMMNRNGAENRMRGNRQRSSQTQNRGRRVRNPYFRNRESERNQNAMQVQRAGPVQLVKIDQDSEYRSVYLPIIRDNLIRSLDVFDFAEPSLVVGKRETSNTPDQALYFLNNKLVIEQSHRLARSIAQKIEDPKGQIKEAFLRAYGREATNLEVQAAYRFYREFKGKQKRQRATADEKLAAVCQAIFASAEFRYLN